MMYRMGRRYDEIRFQFTIKYHISIRSRGIRVIIRTSYENASHLRATVSVWVNGIDGF